MDMDNDPLRPVSNINQPQAPRWFVFIIMFSILVGADCAAIYLMR